MATSGEAQTISTVNLRHFISCSVVPGRIAPTLAGADFLKG
jgi:hypothetical protein